MLPSVFLASHAWLLHASADFPRGAGYYLNLASFGLLLGVFFTWLRVCAWVSNDAHALGLHLPLWSYLTVAGGIAGLVTFWAMPWFFFSFPLLLVGVFGPLAGYVHYRDKLVAPNDRVATRRFLVQVLRKQLRLPLKLPKVRTVTEVLFLQKHNEKPEITADRMLEALQLPGYAQAQRLLQNAIEHEASDLYLEPMQGVVVVQQRIDGTLHPMETLPRSEAEGAGAVLKRLADLDVLDRRKPQRGMFPSQFAQRRLDCFVASSGNLQGERLHVAIADSHPRPRSLAKLGMRPEQLEAWHKLLKLPRGLLLIAGPPESGRTLLAEASMLATQGQELVALQEKRHATLPGVTQAALSTKPDASHVEVVKQALARYAPSHLLVDPIRDAEVANGLYEAVRDRECLVIGVLQAYDALEGLYRLPDLQVPLARVGRMTLGVLSARLVRSLCPECKVRYRPAPDALRRANLPKERVTFLYRPAEPAPGAKASLCAHCGGLGYRGRLAAYEVLVLTESLRELLRSQPSFAKFKQEALKAGYVPLRESLLELVLAGETSMGEMIEALRS